MAVLGTGGCRSLNTHQVTRMTSRTRNCVLSSTALTCRLMSASRFPLFLHVRLSSHVDLASVLSFIWLSTGFKSGVKNVKGKVDKVKTTDEVSVRRQLQLTMEDKRSIERSLLSLNLRLVHPCYSKRVLYGYLPGASDDTRNFPYSRRPLYECIDLCHVPSFPPPDSVPTRGLQLNIPGPSQPNFSARSTTSNSSRADSQGPPSPDFPSPSQLFDLALRSRVPSVSI